MVIKTNYINWLDEDRGFSILKERFKSYSLRSVIHGSILGIISGVALNNIFISILVGITFYALVFSTQTDFRVHKAPKEVSTFSIVFALPVIIVSLLQNYYESERLVVLPYSPSSSLGSFFTKGFAYMDASDLVLNQFLNFGFWILIPTILFFISRGGLGMADIRLFMLLGVTTSWWLGIIPMMLIFFVANLIQIVAFFPAKKRNLGELVTLDNGKEKFAVPFIPAITISYAAGIIFFSLITLVW